MSNTQKLVSAVLLLCVAVIASTYFLFGAKAFGASINRYEAGVWQFGNGIYAGLTQQFAVSNTGAVTSATTTNTTSYWTVGGIDYASVQVSFVSTSSVPAFIPNPWPSVSTSSIQWALCVVTRGVTGANKFDLSTSSNTFIYGSSTPALVYGHSTATGAQDTIAWNPTLIASTTLVSSNSLFTTGAQPDGTSPFILRPQDGGLTLRIATGTPGTLATPYAGTCNAQFARP